MVAITKLTDRFTETAIDDEIVIMRLDTGELFSLSGTAAAAWQLADGQRDRPALIDALAGRYSGDQMEIAGDVDALLAQLAQMGLIADR